MDVFSADSLTLFKTLDRKKVSFLQNPNGTFPKMNQSSFYSFLFQKSFNAHDTLEDVLALRKILFESRIDLSEKTVVKNSSVVTAGHAAEDVIYLDRCHILMQTFKGNLHHLQYLKKNMTEKICGSGLAFQDLQRVQQVWKRRAYCDTFPTTFFIAFAITTSDHHRLNFHNNSQIL